MGVDFESVAGIGFKVTEEQVKQAIRSMADVLPEKFVQDYEDGSYDVTEIEYADEDISTLFASATHPDVSIELHAIGNMYSDDKRTRAFLALLKGKVLKEINGQRNPGSVIPYFAVSEREISGLVELAVRFGIVDSTQDDAKYEKIGFILGSIIS